MENNLKESFLKTKDPLEEKYLPFIDLEFDYEINRVFQKIKIKEDKSSFLIKSQNLEFRVLRLPLAVRLYGS